MLGVGSRSGSALEAVYGLSWDRILKNFRFVNLKRSSAAGEDPASGDTPEALGGVGLGGWKAANGANPGRGLITKSPQASPQRRKPPRGRPAAVTNGRAAGQGGSN